jgi:hypothetical protein
MSGETAATAEHYIEALIRRHEETLEASGRSSLDERGKALIDKFADLDAIIADLDSFLIKDAAVYNKYETQYFSRRLAIVKKDLIVAVAELSASAAIIQDNVRSIVGTAVIHHSTKGPPSTARIIPDQYEPTAPAFDGTNPALPRDPEGVMIAGLVPKTAPVSPSQPVINIRI